MAGKFVHPQKKAIGVKIEQVTCPNCNGALTIRAKGYTQTLVCQYCGTVLDLSNNETTIRDKADKSKKITPLIALGTRGQLHGAMWEVIGFMQRGRLPNDSWEEYLLFNPYKGFRWLTQWRGHWNYVISLHDIPKNYPGITIDYMNKPYRFQETYDAKVQFVLGEFYWKVKVNDTVKVEDYINTPEILTLERTFSHLGISPLTDGKIPQDEELIWSLAEYIEPEDIQKAFKITGRLPVKQGIAANQPFPVAQTKELSYTIGITVSAIAILIIAFCYFLMMSSPENVLATNLSIPQSNFNLVQKNEFTSPSFNITNGKGELEFTFYAPVNNSWLEVDIDVINDKTGQTFNFESGLEYYWGHDSEGGWAEGGQRKSINISHIPEGAYHLNISTQTNHPIALPVDINVRQNVMPMSNFIFAFFLLCLPLLFELFKYISFKYLKNAGDDD